MPEEMNNPLLPNPLIVPPDVEISDDLLIDPVAYPIDTQADIKDIEIEDPNSTDVVVGEHTNQLELAAQSIGELRELESTIKKSGVSSHDMTALCHIQERLGSAGLDMPEVSMEAHGAMYLPLRGYLNQQVALESISGTILATIKAWLAKLIDLAMAGYRWVKNISKRHDVLEAKLSYARSVLTKLDSIYGRMQKLHPNPTLELNTNIGYMVATLLSPARIPNTSLTLYGFCHKETVRTVKDLFADIDSTRGVMTNQINTIIKLMEHNAVTTADVIQPPEVLGKSLAIMGQLEEVSLDPELLENTLGAKVFEDLTPIKTVTTIDFDKLTACYGSLADALQKMKRIVPADAPAAEILQSNIDSLTTTVGQLNDAVSFFSRAAVCQTAVVKAYRDYYAGCMTYLLTDWKACGPSDDSIKEMNKLIKEASQLK